VSAVAGATERVIDLAYRLDYLRVYKEAELILLGLISIITILLYGYQRVWKFFQKNFFAKPLAIDHVYQ
jgi:hypothetical protein